MITGALGVLDDLVTKQASAAIARLEEPAIDWLNALWPGHWIGYTWMFLFGAFCMLVSMFLLGKIDEKKTLNNTQRKQ